jgi:hypothetical protein
MTGRVAAPAALAALLLAAPLLGCASSPPPVSQSPETISLHWDEPGPPLLPRVRGPNDVSVRWNPAAGPEPVDGLAQQACAAGNGDHKAKEVAERRVKSEEVARFDCR